MTWKGIIASIANALMACQDKGVIYRGLDPQNVLFCSSGDTFVVKLLMMDFEWCSDVYDGPRNKVNCVYPEGYRSPEQDVDTDEFDRESAEVYALGCILDDMVKIGLAQICTATRVLTAQMKATNPDSRQSLERIAHHRYLNGDF
jgi:serine/threonine protein kinase